jgi:hypothetical protein
MLIRDTLSYLRRYPIFCKRSYTPHHQWMLPLYQISPTVTTCAMNVRICRVCSIMKLFVFFEKRYESEFRGAEKNKIETMPGKEAGARVNEISSDHSNLTLLSL